MPAASKNKASCEQLDPGLRALCCEVSTEKGSSEAHMVATWRSKPSYPPQDGILRQP